MSTRVHSAALAFALLSASVATAQNRSGEDVAGDALRGAAKGALIDAAAGDASKGRPLAPSAPRSSGACDDRDDSAERSAHPPPLLG